MNHENARRHMEPFHGFRGIGGDHQPEISRTYRRSIVFASLFPI
jgi:hypothetical protein